MKVLITGATGLIGRELVRQCLDESISVHYLTTSKEKLESLPDCKGFYWNLKTEEINLSAFEGVDAIIHMAGATVSKRWTKIYKQKILNSRIDSTNLLYKSLQGMNHSITHFIAASGTSIYPSSETKLYTEDDTEVGTNFLSKVVIAWEKASKQFCDLGMDVALVRTGMVLAKNEGALPKLAKVVKLGLGAPLGTGTQWQSWVHIEDIARIYLFILKKELDGVYNGVAPNPVTNSKLTRNIASYFGAFYWLPKTPEFALKLMLGEMAVLAFDSQLVSSKKLEEQGFVFRFVNLESAIKNLL